MTGIRSALRTGLDAEVQLGLFKVDKLTDLSEGCKRFGKKEEFITYIRNSKGSNSKNIKVTREELEIFLQLLKTKSV